MIIHVDPSDARPLYQQVADEIKRLIARGDLAAGDPLPSVRQVAADLGVNLNTIATAYRDLQDQGLISVRHGSGATVSASKARDLPKTELRKSLRRALAELVLAGMSPSRIMSLVTDELQDLTKGGD